MDKNLNSSRQASENDGALEPNGSVVAENAAHLPESFAISENGTCENGTCEKGEAAKTQPEKTARLTEKQKAEERKKKKKRIEQAAFRSKYFSYYDDVKTNIKEDW